LDGSLFLVRHLLILKEVMTSLDELRAREEGSGLSAAEKERERKRGLGSGRALEFGGIGGMSGGVLGASVSGGVTGVVDLLRSSSTLLTFPVWIETLTNMFTKTTSLLPEGLFASLGVTRGVESDMRGVKLVIPFSTTNHGPNSNCCHSMNPRISTIASERLAKT
jgi:hypothetical protein